jgi:hypothetical protein
MEKMFYCARNDLLKYMFHSHSIIASHAFSILNRSKRAPSIKSSVKNEIKTKEKMAVV